jgi:hypothetical protein
VSKLEVTGQLGTVRDLWLFMSALRGTIHSFSVHSVLLNHGWSSDADSDSEDLDSDSD